MQSSSPLQWHNVVQPSPFALQLHLLVAHGVSLLQPHFKRLSISAGARGLSEGTIVRERAALLRWVKGRRVCLEAMPPDVHHEMTT